MRIAFSFLLWSSCFCVFSQTRSGIAKGELKIGEQSELIYEFSFDDSDGQLSFIPLIAKIPCVKRTANSSLNTTNDAEIEILGKFQDTIIKKGERKMWRGVYKITCWDTGLLVIPPTSISTQDSVFEFQAVILKVSAPVLQNGKDIYGIKEQFVDLPNEYLSWFTDHWMILTLCFVLLLAVVYFIRRKKGKKETPKKELSLKDRTLLALESLEKSKMWENQKLKEHYIELSYILRSYLSSRYELNLLEKTSYQATSLLRQKGLAEDTVRTIKVLFDYSDLAKFAKSKPTELEIYKNLAQVKQIVAETSPLEIDHV